MAYVVIAKWTAQAGHEDEVLAAIRELIPASQAEPGNLQYTAHRDPDDPRVVVFYEQYADEDAFKAHGASEHFERLALGRAIPLLESRERQFLETLDA